MTWIITIIYFGVIYYTYTLSKKEWKANNKLASINITLLALVIIVLSIWVDFENFR